MRKCKKCAIEKEIEEFRKLRNRKGEIRYRHACKECLNAPLRTGKIHTGRFKKGICISPETQFKKGQTAHNKGKKLSLEEVEKLKIQLKVGGPRKPRGGKSRHTVFYANWRKEILQRDCGKCVRCGSIDKLDAHHIVSWKDDEKLRLDISNGETLCRSCHMAHEFIERKNKGISTEFKKGLVPWNKGKKKCHSHML